jgi:hypothetical protein
MVDNHSRLTILYDDDNVMNHTIKINNILSGLHKHNKGVLLDNDNLMY